MKIHTRYDLKGSTVHRTAADGDKVMKDNNLREAKNTFCLGPQREAFLKVGKSRGMISFQNVPLPQDRFLKLDITEGSRRANIKNNTFSERSIDLDEIVPTNAAPLSALTDTLVAVEISIEFSRSVRGWCVLRGGVRQRVRTRTRVIPLCYHTYERKYGM